MLGSCGVTYNYQITVTPPCALITLPDPTVPSISFAASSDLTYVGVYSIEVKAGFTATPTFWPSSATTTFTYANPCASTTLEMGSFSSLTAIFSGSAGKARITLIDAVT
jgi:hypothetical protein